MRHGVPLAAACEGAQTPDVHASPERHACVASHEAPTAVLAAGGVAPADASIGVS
jgi:hypothetical protein